MGSAPSPPPPPDPVATAAAQTGENVSTAIANADLSHVNQTDQRGNSITYNQDGTSSMFDPVGGKTYQIPKFTESTTMSPANAAIYGTNQQTQQNIADIGLSESQKIGSTLGTPVNLGGVQLQGVGDLPNVDLSANNINKFINTRWEQPFERIAGQEQEQLNQNLADQGIHLNDPAYNNAQYNFGQEKQGQQDTYDTAMYGTAANNILSATSLADQNMLNEANQRNQATLQQGGFDQQTQLANREQPLNEVSALMSGSQVAQPNFLNTPQTNIPTTDYATIVNQSYQDQLAAYNAREQNQSAQTGGLFGLGGSLLGGLMMMAPSDRRLKHDVRGLGRLRNGLRVYAYRFPWSLDEEVGLMADEVARVHPEAVSIGRDGFARVNYGMAVQ